MVKEQFKYYPTVTRETFENQGRITDLIESGKLCTDLGFPALNPAEDRIMICGSPVCSKTFTPHALKSVVLQRATPPSLATLSSSALLLSNNCRQPVQHPLHCLNRRKYHHEPATNEHARAHRHGRSHRAAHPRRSALGRRAVDILAGIYCCHHGLIAAQSPR